MIKGTIVFNLLFCSYRTIVGGQQEQYIAQQPTTPGQNALTLAQQQQQQHSETCKNKHVC